MHRAADNVWDREQHLVFSGRQHSSNGGISHGMGKDAMKMMRDNKWFILLLLSTAAVVWATKGLALAVSLLF